MFTHNDALAAAYVVGARCSHNNFIVPGCSFLESGKIQVRKVNALAAGRCVARLLRPPLHHFLFR